MNLHKIKKPFIFTIFGASGDLAKLKLFPALYSLIEQKRFPSEFYIVGFARSSKTQDGFRKEFEKAIQDNFGSQVNPKLLKELVSHVHYYEGQYDNKLSFEHYREYLAKICKSDQISHLAYFAVPPQSFRTIIENLGSTKTHRREDLRVMFEKPFGQNLQEATELYHFINAHFDEDHIYLLDHYLGKTAVKSILYIRHMNRILNQLIQGSEISNIQITAFEKVGVENRIGYFDQVGTIKDMVQSHLLQLLALTTMSIPVTLSAENLQREKQNIISSLSISDQPGNVILGQHSSYQKEHNLKKSKTETFAAIKLILDRIDWFKVPIYIRTGKKLDQKATYLCIEFKKFAFQDQKEKANLLFIEISPHEKISLKLINKIGPQASIYQEITTSESIACFGDDCLPEHGILILDALSGRKENFLSFAEIIASWTITEKILNYIKNRKIKPEKYSDNSSGPKGQQKLTAHDGFEWHNLSNDNLK